LQPEPKYQTQSYITYIYMSIRKVSVSVTIQPTAKAQRTQRRKAEVEKMRSWEAEKLRNLNLSTSHPPNFFLFAHFAPLRWTITRIDTWGHRCSQMGAERFSKDRGKAREKEWVERGLFSFN